MRLGREWIQIILPVFRSLSSNLSSSRMFILPGAHGRTWVFSIRRGLITATISLQRKPVLLWWKTLIITLSKRSLRWITPVVGRWDLRPPGPNRESAPFLQLQLQSDPGRFRGLSTIMGLTEACHIYQVQLQPLAFLSPFVREHVEAEVVLSPPRTQMVQEITALLLTQAPIAFQPIHRRPIRRAPKL